MGQTNLIVTYSRPWKVTGAEIRSPLSFATLRTRIARFPRDCLFRRFSAQTPQRGSAGIVLTTRTGAKMNTNLQIIIFYRLPQESKPSWLTESREDPSSNAEPLRRSELAADPEILPYPPLPTRVVAKRPTKRR